MTVTLTVPAAPAGVVAVIVVLFTTVTPVALLVPTLTVAPATKLDPLTVIAVPPVVRPLVGDTPLTVGGFINVKALVLIAAPAGVVTLSGPVVAPAGTVA